MFITNNHASFHLWSKDNLVKHQKVSKYYDQEYSLVCSVDLFHISKSDYMYAHGFSLYYRLQWKP